MRPCIEWLVGILAVLLFGLVLNWPRLVNMAVQYDLREYANAVRQSHLPLEDKERLLDLTDKLQDHLQAGSRVGMLRWQRSDEAVRLLLSDDINGDDLRLIERELRRIENAISSDR